MIACKYHMIVYDSYRWCQSARLVSSGLSNCAEVMMGFIFGVERTLKLPLMISLRRPDRTRWIQDGPFVGDTLRLKLRLLRGWGYLRYIWDIRDISGPSFHILIWHHMDLSSQSFPSFPFQSFPSFPFQANWQRHCLWWPACHASWLSDALPVFWYYLQPSLNGHN